MNYGQNTQVANAVPGADKRPGLSATENGSQRESGLAGSDLDLNSSKFPDSFSPNELGNTALRSTETSTNNAIEVPASILPDANQRPNAMPDLSHNPVFDPTTSPEEDSPDKEALGKVVDLNAPELIGKDSDAKAEQGTAAKGPDTPKKEGIEMLKAQIDTFMRDPDPDPASFYEMMQEDREQDSTKETS